MLDHFPISGNTGGCTDDSFLERTFAMADVIRVGILGGGWPGKAHARAYAAVPGYKLTAVADLIPARRKAMMEEFKIEAQYADAADLIEKAQVDAVSICLPNDLHAPMAVAAMKNGKHVLCETPAAINAREARNMAAVAARTGRVLLYAAQRRFGANEQASHQAIAKGYAGAMYHARASWMRTRAVPIGTGWFTDKARSGGGALIDLGFHMLDLGWYLLGQPQPAAVFASTHRRLTSSEANAATSPAEEDCAVSGEKDDNDAPTSVAAGQSAASVRLRAATASSAEVEDAAFALVRFQGGQSLELSTSWAMNQPPSQNGTVCRVHGERGALDVYTPSGALLHRGFGDKGESRETALKLPKLHGHPALVRHFRECILGKATPLIGASEGAMLMGMIEAIYKSAQSGRSAGV
jgi:predicted dehydrogenase